MPRGCKLYWEVLETFALSQTPWLCLPGQVTKPSRAPVFFSKKRDRKDREGRAGEEKGGEERRAERRRGERRGRERRVGRERVWRGGGKG